MKHNIDIKDVAIECVVVLGLMAVWVTGALASDTFSASDDHGGALRDYTKPYMFDTVMYKERVPEGYCMYVVDSYPKLAVKAGQRELVCKTFGVVTLPSERL